MSDEVCGEYSIYGKVRAFTPLLDEPLEGNVYLRSSSNPLPDLVFALRGVVDVNAVARVDSVDASLRTSFESIPDAPLSKVVVEMQGGKKGLIVNSRNLCAHQSKAKAGCGVGEPQPEMAIAADHAHCVRLTACIRQICAPNGRST